jgi:hypothetical protein
MNTSECIQVWQTIAGYLTFCAALLAAYFAWSIGKRQNEINERSLNVHDFIETFVMPQQVIAQNETGGSVLAYYNLAVKNASTYPIYLTSFILNGVSHLVGNSIIPTGSDNWYAIPIPKDIQQKSELTLQLEFEDYLGNKYHSSHNGVFENLTWQIRSQKTVPTSRSSRAAV